MKTNNQSNKHTKQHLRKIILLVFIIIIHAEVSAEGAKKLPQFIVHFKTGPAWDDSLEPSQQQQFQAHSDNLNKLRREGVIVFGARYSDLGLIILQADTLDAAKKILDADPGVIAGTFIYSLHKLNVFYPWQ